MPKKHKRKGRKKSRPHSHKTQSSEDAGTGNLIRINNQTIIVYNAGDNHANGVYSHKCLDGDYFERIGSVQSHKHSQINTDNNDQQNNDNQEQKTYAPAKPRKYEIDYHEYLKNPQDLPDERLNKSGAWILSRTDVYPNQLLYAVNCPFKNRIPMNAWLALQDALDPAPRIKVFETRQVTNDAMVNDVKLSKKRKKNATFATSATSSTSAVSDVLKVSNQQFKAIQNASKQARKKRNIENKLMIVSGGQTGTDRAALDVAIALNIPYGGWIPKNRKAEDGVIDAKYDKLKECNSENYERRTLLNVVDSDATLILNMGKLEGGTLKTKQYVSHKEKDLMYITLFASTQTNELDDEKKNDDDDGNDMDVEEDEDENEESYADILGYSDGRAQRVSEWIRIKNIFVLNIAGPRESERKGVYDESVKFLTSVLRHFQNGEIPNKCLFS